MNSEYLQDAISIIKKTFEQSIQTASFDGKKYDNGQKAKEALIRSQKLILYLHEVVKKSLHEYLTSLKIKHNIYPPLNASKPELKIAGFIKAKNQDVVVMFNKNVPTSEVIKEGPLKGLTDVVGQTQSEQSIVIGVRSQLSSVAKNFDTLMERAFAETLNLRLRLNNIVMGEVYLLSVREYDDKEMEKNRVISKGSVPVEKFIRTFLGISGRNTKATDDNYKYERSVLLLVDFFKNPPLIYTSLAELKKDGLVSKNCDLDYSPLSPVNFSSDLIKSYRNKHKI